jgi:hypothetical protein
MIMSYLNEGDRNPWSPRTNLTAGLILFMVIVGGGAAWYYHDAIFGPGNTPSGRLERELNIGAQMINRRAPIRVDDNVTLTGAEVHGNQFTYKYTVREDVPTERIEEARQAILQEAGTRLCSDPNMSQVLRMGAIISADYLDPSGDHIRVTFPGCPGLSQP